MGIFSKNIRQLSIKVISKKKSYFDQFYIITVISRLGYLKVFAIYKQSSIFEIIEKQ